MLQDILKGKIVIVGIGNTLKGDDGFGPALVAALQGKVKAALIDAGTAPENYTGTITKLEPDTILLVDAVHLDKPAGEWAILGKKDILRAGLTTHDLSPDMLIEYLENTTKARIYLLGVQPKTLEFGDQMSEEVKNTLEDIVKCMKHI